MERRSSSLPLPLCGKCGHEKFGNDTDERHMCAVLGCSCPLISEKPTGFLVYIATKNDVNGNPRRGWIHFSSDGIPQAFYNEGFSSHGAIPKEVQRANLPETGRLLVVPTEYRYWMKWDAKRIVEKVFNKTKAQAVTGRISK